MFNFITEQRRFAETLWSLHRSPLSDSSRIMSNSDHIIDGTPNKRSNEEEDDVQLSMLTEQLKALVVFVPVLRNRKILNNNSVRLMMSCQRLLRSRTALNRAQSDIWPFLVIYEMLLLISVFSLLAYQLSPPVRMLI